MAKRGPKGPSTEIDWDTFEKLCGIHCTKVEIAEWFHCSEDTIERHVKRHYGENFAVVYAKKAARGNASLRRRMFETAFGTGKGAVTMQIFLSKQHLGYLDRLETKNQNQNLNYEMPEPTLIVLPSNGREKKE
jgi:hypothetical protein